MDVTDIQTELGAYYRVHKKELLKMLKVKTDSMNYMTTVLSIKGQYATVAGIIDDVVQSFSTTWAPKGIPKFVPNIIVNRRHKINVPIVPDEVQNTWLAFMYDEGKTRAEMPITKYILEELVIPKVNSNRELKIIGKGVYNAGTPTTTGASMDGFLAIIAAGVADGSMYKIPLPSITPTNIIDVVEKFVDNLPEGYQGVPMNIFMSPANKKAFLRRDKALHGVNPSYKKGEEMVDFSNQTIVGLNSMIGSNVIFATPKENFLRLIDINDGASKIEFQVADYTVKIFADWWEGVGFATNQAVFVATTEGQGSGLANDQEMFFS